MQERTRGLAVALLCSLLGHGALLFAMPLLLPPMQTPRLAGTMEVSLVRLHGGEAHAALPAAAPPTETPPDMAPKPMPVPRTHVPVPSRTPVISTPIPPPGTEQPLSVAAVGVAEPAREGGSSASQAMVAAAAQPTGTAGASRQGAAIPEGMNDALQDYRFAISSAAGKFKRYPALSRARGREGRVEVRLSWHPGMRAPQVELHAGAGDRLLDEQGLAMLHQAAEQTLLPPVLRERAFSFVLPIEFSLKEVN